jgi:acetyl esterase/lipase
MGSVPHSAAGEPAGIKTEERWTRFPDSVSAEARAALIRQVRADGVPFNALATLPSPDDHAGWSTLQQTVGRHYARAEVASADTVYASIETLRIGEATVHRAVPDVMASAESTFIDLHGGAFVFGGGDACRVATRMAADRHQVVCYGVDYRMPPQSPYPAALDDCLATYRHVLTRHRPGNIIVAGRSAGGNLAAAMVLRARDEGLPLPAALVLLSPELDLTESGDSYQVNRTTDVVLPGSLMAANLLYADGADLAHPYLSPLFGAFDRGFPPTFLQAGTRDLFLSSVVRMHRLLRKAQVETELHVFEAMPHGGFGGAPEDSELASEVSRYVRAQWTLAAGG